MKPLDSDAHERLSGILSRHRHRPGPLLEVLHAVQGEFGHVPAAAIPTIAAELNLSRAEVQGVVSFYHFFLDHPPGRHRIEICRAEACQSMRGEALQAHAKRRLGVDFHGTSADGRFTLLPVYCLGNCACAPAVMIDGQLHGRVDPARFDELLTELGTAP